jgi:hypothetical protein
VKPDSDKLIASLTAYILASAPDGDMRRAALDNLALVQGQLRQAMAGSTCEPHLCRDCIYWSPPIGPKMDLLELLDPPDPFGGCAAHQRQTLAGHSCDRWAYMVIAPRPLDGG